jgi:pSer/pThr/pTyr-binding forkhead associated (FHA) protein
VDVQLVLFLLRIAAALLLLSVVAVIFFALWRDFRLVVVQTSAQRRIYGQLVELHVEEGEETEGAQTEIIHPLLPLTSIGRAPTNTIPIHDDFASAEHALIALRDGQWWLEDRHSRNGTLINGMPIINPIVITSGDIIGVGNHRFRVDIER